MGGSKEWLYLILLFQEVSFTTTFPEEKVNKTTKSRIFPESSTKVVCNNSSQDSITFSICEFFSVGSFFFQLEYGLSGLLLLNSIFHSYKNFTIFTLFTLTHYTLCLGSFEK